MAAPVITIRPEPGSSATVAAANARGLAIEAWPLFEVRPLPWDAPDPKGFDGVLLGSANPMRHGGDALALFRGKPAWTVGAATAEAALSAGFSIAMQGRGGLQSVLDAAAGPLRLLRLAGADHVPLNTPQGVDVVTRIVYESRPVALPAGLVERLPGAVILLHSAAAARHFSAEVDRVGAPRETMRLAALGPRIAQAAGDGWRDLCNAANPSDDELLDLVAEMCHDRSGQGG